VSPGSADILSALSAQRELRFAYGRICKKISELRSLADRMSALHKKTPASLRAFTEPIS
jgi:hypothetical protein